MQVLSSKSQGEPARRSDQSRKGPKSGPRCRGGVTGSLRGRATLVSVQGYRPPLPGQRRRPCPPSLPPSVCPFASPTCRRKDSGSPDRSRMDSPGYRGHPLPPPLITCALARWQWARDPASDRLAPPLDSAPRESPHPLECRWRDDVQCRRSESATPGRICCVGVGKLLCLSAL